MISLLTSVHLLLVALSVKKPIESTFNVCNEMPNH